MKKFRNKNYMGMLLEELNLDKKDLDLRYVIRNNAQFENRLIKGEFKKDQVDALSITLHYKKNQNKYYKRIEVAGITQSRVVDVNNFEEVKVVDKGRIVKVKKFSNENISVKLTETARKAIADQIFGGTLFIVHNPFNGYVNMYLEKELVGGTVYYDFSTQKDYTLDQIKKDGCVVRKYRLNPVTASGTRNGSGVFKNVTLKDDRFELFDKATCGGLRKQRIRIEEALGKVSNATELKKVETAIKKDYGYLGNVSAGTFSLGKVQGHFVYNGKFLNSTCETFLTKEFVDTLEELSILSMKAYDSESEYIKGLDRIEELKSRIKELEEKGSKLEEVATQDGQMYVNVIQLAVMIYKTTGYIVDPYVLLGRMIQCRPATIKASAIVVSPFVFDMLVEGAKNLAATYNTSVTPYGDESKALFIADKNCIKLDFDFEKDFDFEILAFNKTSEGHGSKQIYKNIMYAAEKQGLLKKALRLIAELEHSSLDKKLNNAITTEREARMPTPNEVLNAIKTGYCTNVLTDIAPTFIRESKPLMESSIRQAVNSMINDVDRMHGKLTIESRRLASDPTFIITGGKLNGILELGESFINDSRIDRSVMFKYPIAGLEEQYQNRNVLLANIIKAVKNKVKQKVITFDEGGAIISFFAELKRTVRVLPALMFLANACAGLDFDYDGECSIIKVKEPKTREEEISNELCDILLANKMRGVLIKID